MIKFITNCVTIYECINIILYDIKHNFYFIPKGKFLCIPEMLRELFIYKFHINGKVIYIRERVHYLVI